MRNAQRQEGILPLGVHEECLNRAGNDIILIRSEMARIGGAVGVAAFSVGCRKECQLLQAELRSGDQEGVPGKHERTLYSVLCTVRSQFLPN